MRTGALRVPRGHSSPRALVRSPKPKPHQICENTSLPETKPGGRVDGKSRVDGETQHVAVRVCRCCWATQPQLDAQRTDFHAQNDAQ